MAGLGLAESRLSTQARGAIRSPALPKQEHPAPWIQTWRWDSSVPSVIQGTEGALESSSPPGCCPGTLCCPPACLSRLNTPSPDSPCSARPEPRESLNNRSEGSFTHVSGHPWERGSHGPRLMNTHTHREE